MLGTRIRKGLELHAWKGVVAALSLSQPLYAKLRMQRGLRGLAQTKMAAPSASIVLAVAGWLLGCVLGYWWFGP